MTRINAILAGGPVHGRRIQVSAGCSEYLAPYADPDDIARLTAPVRVPPRPPWWRLAQRRRRTGLPDVPDATFTLLSYRPDGHLDDGTAIYWLNDSDGM